MSEPEALRQLVQAWVEKAEEDLAVAARLLPERQQFLHSIGFHCQQAAEKMLKGFLQHRDMRPPKIHNLPRLLDLCVAFDVTFETLAAACDRLSPLAVDTRYPDLSPLQDPEEADEVLARTREVYEFVEQRLA